MEKGVWEVSHKAQNIPCKVDTRCIVQARSSFQLTVDPITGVMRFLQMEWHRHERERNAWEIEKAEMKSRVGKLEGDGRTSKRMQESLGKHVKILESALRKEREKTRKLQAGGSIEGEKTETENERADAKGGAEGQWLWMIEGQSHGLTIQLLFRDPRILIFMKLYNAN